MPQTPATWAERIHFQNQVRFSDTGDCSSLSRGDIDPVRRGEQGRERRKETTGVWPLRAREGAAPPLRTEGAGRPQDCTVRSNERSRAP